MGETRLYQPGDDTRRIDWNVTARMQAPHVRETIADRELETWLLIDQSASLDFGTANCEKRDLVLNAAGAVGFLTVTERQSPRRHAAAPGERTGHRPRVESGACICRPCSTG